MDRYILFDVADNVPVAIVETYFGWYEVQQFIYEARKQWNKKKKYQGWTLSEVLYDLMDEEMNFEITYFNEMDSLQY